MKKVNLISMISLVLLLGAITVACGGTSDEDVKKAVETALSETPEAENIVVSVANKVVTLTGTVTDDSVKAAIENTVAAVKNVKSVTNELEIVPPAPDFSAADAAIKEGLATILSDYKDVTATVEKGVITLSGTITKVDWDTLKTKLDALNPQEIVNNLEVK